MAKEKSFGFVPVLTSGREYLFLLVRQRKGHWGFPKGRGEEGETPIESARRELWEETGIKSCEVCDCKPLIEEYMKERHGELIPKIVTYFVGKVKGRDVTLQEAEIMDHAWLTYDEARKRITFDHSKKTLDEVFRYLKASKS